MRKLSFISLALVSVLIVSCGGGKGGDAKSVADKFVKSFFIDMDIDGSRQYVTWELQNEFPESSQMGDLEKHFIGILQEHARTHGYKAEYDAARSEVDGDSADIYYILTAKGNPQWSGFGEVELEKNQDGKWVVTDYEFDRDEESIDFGF